MKKRLYLVWRLVLLSPPVPGVQFSAASGAIGPACLCFSFGVEGLMKDGVNEE